MSVDGRAASGPPRADVVGLSVDRVDYRSCVDRVLAAAAERRFLPVAAANVHMVMEARDDAALRALLADYALVVPDGQPVRWMANATREEDEPPLADRVYGPELMRRVVEAAAIAGRSVYWFGATPATLEALTERFEASAPGLVIAGAHAPGFGDALWRDVERDRQRIVDADPDIVFVGLGCPRQERWIGRHGPPLARPCLAVGAAFDLWAGRKAMAPGWMQRAGLEWLFRLGTEPGRTWRRYLWHNPRFVALAGAQLARNALAGSSARTAR